MHAMNTKAPAYVGTKRTEGRGQESEKESPEGVCPAQRFLFLPLPFPSKQKFRTLWGVRQLDLKNHVRVS